MLQLGEDFFALPRPPSRSPRGDHERRSEAHDGAVRVLRQDAVREEAIDDAPCGGARRVDLDADEQPRPRTSRTSGLAIAREAGKEPRAERRGALGEALVDDARSASRGPTAAASGLPPNVLPWSPGRNTPMTSSRARNADTGSNPPPERLAEHEPVGLHAVVVAREQLAGAAEAGLHLVGDEQHVALAADPRARGEIAGRRHDDAALALDRLDEERGGVRRDRALERRRVAERHQLKPGGNGPKPSRYCASEDRPMIVIERPWKLPSQAMISARSSGTRFTLYAHLRAALSAVSTASSPVFTGSARSMPVSRHSRARNGGSRSL